MIAVLLTSVVFMEMDLLFSSFFFARDVLIRNVSISHYVVSSINMTKVNKHITYNSLIYLYTLLNNILFWSIRKQEQEFIR
jgi:hypothetical protein